ncbi:MAG: M14 family zinc carboxypeptidase [Solirubrobacteraceae bacterium]
MRRALVPVLALLALLAALVGGSGGVTPSAGAAGGAEMQLQTVLDEPLGGALGTTAIPCQASWRPGTSGIATKTVTVPAGIRFLAVTLGGAKGDWDVAVFDATGSAVVASAELGSTESATGWTSRGGTLRVQACRRTGSAAVVPVTLDEAAPVGDAAAAKANAPQLVSVNTPTREAKDRLLALGLDVSEHGGEKSVGVVLENADERAALRKAGLTYDIVVDDLIAQAAGQRREETRMATRAAGAILPSGRTGTYRTLADYNAEMKMLAEKNPNLVRAIVLPNKTLLGKDVMGLEIAEDVKAKDGRPAFFNMGVHHAREWPAGEMPMEWAYELITGYKSGDARATKIVKRSRNIIVPIVNPDGFEASRTAGELAGQSGGRDEAVDDTVYLVAGTPTGGEYRRKNCRLPDDSDAANCATSAGLVEPGVDPNRNYGGLWGGPGASTDVTSQTYRGKAPFSEPETLNVRDVVSKNQVMTLLTNHTTAALVLRAPGLAVLGDPVDENKGYKALGDAMAKQTGYLSQNGFELYDTTGTTEDWSYNATGGFGFTIEIYCGAVNYETGDCEDPAFHPTFNTGVEREWNGDNPVADHTKDPAGAFDGKGLREAYYIAAESTIDDSRHSIIEGKATPGATLRLTKSFKTETFPQPDPEGGEDKPLLFDDKLETTYEVGDDGTFEWHVNPSTRPIVAKSRGKENPGEPSPVEKTTGGPQGSSETEDDPDDGAATADPVGAGVFGTANYNDHPFAIPATGDNGSVAIEVTWPTQGSDWDIELFEDTNGNGKSDPGTDASVGTSAQGPTNFEEVSVSNEAGLEPGKKYVLRVVNFAASEPYEVKKTYTAPKAFQAGRKEFYKLTCEVGGNVISTQDVFIERGERKTLDLGACASQVPVGGGSGQCKATRGFSSVGVKPQGSGALLGFKKRAGVGQAVRIDIFKPGTATKVLKTRKIRKFAASQKSVKWNGEDKKGQEVGPGFYFVRYLVKTAKGVDVRRVVLQRSNGRFRVLKAFDRRDTCGPLRQFKLSRPVFGGSTAVPLNITYRLGAAADIEVLVRRGSKVVSRFKRAAQPAGRLLKLIVKSKGLKRGDYTVSLRATAGTATIAATAVARRI